MICEDCKRCKECELSKTFISIQDTIRITECDDYEPTDESKKVIDIFKYRGK